MDLYIAFIGATFVLLMIPGPNVALIVANSVSYGSRYGLVTVAGTSSAMLVQLLLTIVGMTAFLGVMASWFELLRWIGVAYLIWLGVQAGRAPSSDLSTATGGPRPNRKVWLRGFLVSLTNPKTLLFYGAFLPQFIQAEGDITAQLILLSATFFVLAVLVDSCWALLAGRFRAALVVNGRWRNRITGGLLVGAAAGLALARRP
jgi:threonine/homoserine/homoserine lactone efflux protein